MPWDKPRWAKCGCYVHDHRDVEDCGKRPRPQFWACGCKSTVHGKDDACMRTSSSASPQWTCGCTGNNPDHEKRGCYVGSKNDSSVMNDIELEARKIVRNGIREAAYGEPGKDFKRTSIMWSGLLRDKLKKDITPEDVASMMMILKLSRLAETPHHYDSMVDVIGYMICYDRLEPKEDN